MDINKNFDQLSQIESLKDTASVIGQFDRLFYRIEKSAYDADVINRREQI